MHEPAAHPQSPASGRVIAQQRRLFALAAGIIGGYYVAFAFAGVYTPVAAVVGCGISLVLGLASWALREGAAPQSPLWPPVLASAVSALGVATSALAGGSACIGFHAFLGTPLLFATVLPHSLSACLAGSAVAYAGGLALLTVDGVPAVQRLQWSAIFLGVAAFAARRIVLSRRELQAILADERAALARVAASERHFRVMADHVLDVIWTMDPATGRFTYTSPAVKALLGYAPADMTGLTFAETLAPEAQERARAVLALIGTPDEPPYFTGMLEHVCRDGTRKQVDVIATAARTEDGQLEVVGVSRDVTARRQLEEDLRQAQKLEGVGRLAGGVAHDFNNLLTVILGLSAAMEEDLAAGIPATAEDVRAMRTAAERGRDLVKQLLAFARKQVFSPATLDVDAVIAAASPLLRGALGEDVRLEHQPAGRPCLVRCDRGALEQVLLNLALNARDAMPRGGTLRLETIALEVLPVPGIGPGDLEAGAWVRLRVDDTGTGLSPEVRAHLFEPFFTTKPPGKGSGLGLAMVHGIVTQSGGSVRVSSAAGGGARFDLYFPRCDTEAADAAPFAAAPGEAAPETTRRRGETVLVVEDDEVVRGVTARVLRGAGYRVLTAGGGREALARASAEPGPLHAAVVDIVMPELSGPEVVAALARIRPETAILYVSGYPRDALEHRGHADPSIPLLAKPFTPAALLAAVRGILSAGLPPPGAAEVPRPRAED